MTASDISSIVVTVALTQLVCDLIGHWRIFQKERYGRVVAAYERAKWKRDKAWKDAREAGVEDPSADPSTLATAEGESTNKSGGNKAVKKGSGGGNKDNKKTRLTKMYQRADQDCTDAGSLVARQHMLPNMLTSLVFVILMRILGTEYKGHVVGILPFTPWSFVRRLTMRGLEFRSDLAFEPVEPEKVSDMSQAVSFIFIYMLTTLSVKFYVNKLFGTSPPPGADGLVNLTQSSWAKRVLKQVGMEPPKME